MGGDRVWMRGVLAVMLVLVGGGGDARTTTKHHHLRQLLLQEKEIIQQLALIDKLVGVMLDATECGDEEKGGAEQRENTTAANPQSTKEPQSTKAPQSTKEPQSTKAPQSTKEPQSTKAPQSTKEPQSTKAPQSTKEPQSTKDPSDCQYSEFSPSHTMLKTQNTACEIHKTGLSTEEKEQILTLHNDLRAKVARGEETRGSPGPQPPAANMRQLVWNDELAQVAQAWASQCPSGHDSAKERAICTRDYYVGQNIHYYWGFDEKSNWKKAVHDWYEEVADMPNSFAASFKLHKTKKIGHYTQVVWADTSEVGCGLVYYEVELKGTLFPESKIYVCNYGAAGNVRSRPMYAEGPAVSKCPGIVSSTYPDLCV